MGDVSVQSAAQAGVRESLEIVDKMADSAIANLSVAALIGTSTVGAVVDVAKVTSQNTSDALTGSAAVILKEVEEETQQLTEIIQKWRESTRAKLEGALVETLNVLPGEDVKA